MEWTEAPQPTAGSGVTGVIVMTNCRATRLRPSWHHDNCWFPVVLYCISAPSLFPTLRVDGQWGIMFWVNVLQPLTYRLIMIGLHEQDLCTGFWPPLNIKTVFPGMGISIIKMRRSWYRLTLIMGIHIMLRRHLHFETDPCTLDTEACLGRSHCTHVMLATDRSIWGELLFVYSYLIDSVYIFDIYEYV